MTYQIRRRHALDCSLGTARRPDYRGTRKGNTMRSRRSATSTSLAFALLATAGLLLTSCSPGGESPSPSGVVTVIVTPSPTPVVTPSPTPTFVAFPPIADLRITTSGLLPLTIGLDAATNPGAAMISWNETYCYSEVTGVTTDTGRWVSNYPGGLFSLNGHYAPSITRIDIWDDTLSTPESIHIGSTLADLTATYPGLVTGTPSYSTTPYWISDTHGYVVFEVGSGTVEGAPGPDQVWFIRVLARDSNPDYVVASSGNVADACF
jgi:hypothetical protein